MVYGNQRGCIRARKGTIMVAVSLALLGAAGLITSARSRFEPLKAAAAVLACFALIGSGICGLAGL